MLRNSRDDILFHRRRDFGMWDLPGGSAEFGESIESCVVREVYEETGLSIERFTPIGFASDPESERVTYPNGDIIQGFSLILLATLWSGTLSVSDESTELRFFPLDQLPDLRPSIAATIQRLLRFEATGEFQLF